MYDYHTHTFFSMDSSLDPEEAILRAIKVGLKEIAITDHCEFNVWQPNGTFGDGYVDIEKYTSRLEELREKYKERLKIKIGLEVGLQREEKMAIDQFLNRYEFDFIIGSSHTIDRIDLYYGQIYEGHKKESSYKKYFNEVLEIVRVFDNYSVYGHIDLIRRYAMGKYEDVELTTLEIEIIRDILKTIIEKGKGIEVNTSGYRYGLNSTNPGVEVLKLYKELGGEIITVGSDAHKKSDVGYKIKETYDLLSNLGYKYITIFEKMNPIFINI